VHLFRGVRRRGGATTVAQVDDTPSLASKRVEAHTAGTARSASGWVRPSHISIWLAGFLLLCFVYFLPRPVDAEQHSHLDTTLVLVDHGNFIVDGYYPTYVDSAFYRGHYYSNKAPGLSLAGVPIYAAFKAVFHRSLGPYVEANITRSRLEYFVLLYLECVFTVSIPATLLLLLFFWFLGYFSASVMNRAILTIALGLGTVIFPYARVFFSHIPATALLFAGFVLVWILGKDGSIRGAGSAWLVAHPRSTAFLAGLALGAAVLFEYPAALISLLVGIYALTCLPRRLWPYLTIGVLPGIFAILAYDFAVYGNPLVTGYSDTTTVYRPQLAPQHGGGTFSGLTWRPQANAMWGLSFSPFRGLFFLSPFLLLAFPGYILWARQRGREWLLFLTIPIALFFAVSMFAGWDGGWAIGPRYLILMLPFLAVPVIFVLDRVSLRLARLAIYALIGISFVSVWIESVAGGVYPLTNIPNPLFTFSLPALAHGNVRFNLGAAVLFAFAGQKSALALLTLLPLFALLALWSLVCLRRRAARLVPAPSAPSLQTSAQEQQNTSGQRNSPSAHRGRE
jgi:hypothetical protein